MAKTLQQARYERIWEPCTLVEFDNPLIQSPRYLQGFTSRCNLKSALDVGALTLAETNPVSLKRNSYFLAFTLSINARLFPSLRVKTLHHRRNQRNLFAAIGFPLSRISITKEDIGRENMKTEQQLRIVPTSFANYVNGSISQTDPDNSLRLSERDSHGLSVDFSGNLIPNSSLFRMYPTVD
jgi:hypothetical protein